MRKSAAWPREFPGANWYDRQEERAVLNVLRGKAPFRYYGVAQPRYVAAFEEEAKKVYGVRHALAVNSGTGALMTAMTALGIGPGSEVIVPAFLWVSTVGAVVHANAIPVLCEVDDSLSMNPDDLECKITPRTRLIVAVHMAGAPCDMKRIVAVARKRRIPVLEDCAQCNGGTVEGKSVGSFGQIGMFSLQINKNITAGEGGLLVTDDEGLYLKMLAAHDVGALWRGGGLVPDPRYVAWGTGRRMAELIGAVASVQLGKLARVVGHMRASKKRLKAMLEDTPGLAWRRLNDPAGDTACCLVFYAPDRGRAARTVAAIRDSNLFGASRLAEYGMHIYYNIPQLVHKAPLSPAGNPWSLPQNAGIVREYGKGACPTSDALFERAVILSIPSTLTRPQEQVMAGILRGAVLQA
ncbi:MAG: aminotransferase class I/II-fold pyridoxal phosphate-dependent enzyme [Planctomycetota bacterium]|nr:aminotransferase class I/II-fold pyridoxal phosphate-dependent enzyme [Planctomycetota bacterium]